ncbi:MAG TPA: GNAT family N-acetyltransferase [Acidimicrobiia bacterium]|nr:GNAT family N-acetyltransferase [Acidimicrobiia bacterium]
MAYTIRAARADDIDSVTPWTTDTFAWGDYVPDRMPEWLEESDSGVLVAVDENDAPVAMVHVTMLSDTEAWIEGARVHPDHRRMGIGSELNHAGVDWARQRGGRVMRLAVEAENAPARRQVKALGYREVSSWVHTLFEIDPSYRAREMYRLRPAPGSDAEAAWLFWAASELAREGRELIANHWQWRTARPDDVTTGGELLQSPAGWVSITSSTDDSIATRWFATTPEGLLHLFDGLLDLAAQRSVVQVDVKLPKLGWTSEAITRFGGNPSEILVYTKQL